MYSSPASLSASVTPSLNAMMKSPGCRTTVSSSNVRVLEQTEHHAAGLQTAHA